MKKIQSYTDDKFDVILDGIKALQIDASALKTDVASLKKDMNYVKENLNDIIENTTEIMGAIVTQQEHRELKKRVALLEQS